MDEYANQHKFVPDIIKIDVEGSEMAILEGASGILENKHPMVIICELNATLLNLAGTSSKEVFKYMGAHKFEAFVPKSWPFEMKKISQPPSEDWIDNIFFMRNF